MDEGDSLGTIKNLSDLKLNSWLIRQCQTFGVKTPTEIQKAVIPHILNGEDCIGCAKTGSGKTLAFALPILQKWCEDPYGIFALILTPTRELAYQIGDQFIVLGKPMNLRVSIITGGIDMVRQGLELSTRPHIVIATPGRLADHMDACNTFSLARIKYLVLDEADRLLGAPGGNFDRTLKTIFKGLPQQKQTLLFSATMTDTLEQVKTITNKQVFVWEAKQEVATVEELDQYYVLCPYDIKDGYLVETVRLYREKSPSGAIVIFTDTCRSCQVLSMMLNDIGLQTVALHGMISQRQRLAALSQFKSNQVKILVATDVASRGLDIAGVELVVNYNIPPSPKDYIHRVGRTARAGRYGNAISLVTPYDIQLLKDVEEAVGTKLEEFAVQGKKVSEIYMQVSVTRREAELKLDETEFDARKMVNKRKKLILAGKSPEEADEIIRAMEEKKKKWQERRKSGKASESGGAPEWRRKDGGSLSQKRRHKEGKSDESGGGMRGDKSKKVDDLSVKMKGGGKQLKGECMRVKVERQKLKDREEECDSKERVCEELNDSNGRILMSLGKKKRSKSSTNSPSKTSQGESDTEENDEKDIFKISSKNRKSLNKSVDGNGTPVKKRKSLGMVWNESGSVEEDSGCGKKSAGLLSGKKNSGSESTSNVSFNTSGVSSNNSSARSTSSLRVRKSKADNTSDLRFVEKKGVSNLRKKLKAKSKSCDLGLQRGGLKKINLAGVKTKKLKRNAADLDEIKDLLGL